ncbi:MAG TPA: hypothetical protein VFZ00_11345 [Solirubrobacter sp.]|nr:hypothetical protein [Solirubrobacter sp.]
MKTTMMFIGLVVASACGPSHRELCERNHGTWTAVNCHEEDSQICQTTDYGNGMQITTCIPMTSTVCDYTCLGSAAEDSRP